MSIPDLLDNSPEKTVSNILNRQMHASTQLMRVRIVSAFFNLGGYLSLADGLDKSERVQILLGREQDRDLVLSERLKEDLEQALNQRREAPMEIARFQNFLRKQVVEIKHFSQRFLHGKAYILDGVPGFGSLGVVGSSNFTQAGMSQNFELNAVLKQTSAVQELNAWFDRFWADENAQDYKADLLTLLTDFTQVYSPYEIYMKALYEYFKDRLSTDIQPGASDISPIVLANFQHDGYWAAKDILATYDGVILADCVGFGKTFLALRLLDDYAYRLRQKSLIVCPAQLRDTLWTKKLRLYGIRADIETMERLGQTDFPFENYAQHEIVVVDESHNFRNDQTNRWQNLFRLLHTGKKKKMIQLTATPINNTVFDLYNQIRLISGDKKDFFLQANIPNLEGYFRQAQQHPDKLFEILEEISVRRSRQYIRQNYPDAEIDGQKIHFPLRLIHNVDYSLAKSFGNVYKEIATTIENLHLAPYNIEIYRNDIPKVNIERMMEELRKQGRNHQEILDILWRLGRKNAVVLLQKVLYLKRMESSVEAIRISLGRQISFQERFLQCLKRGRLINADLYRKFLHQEDEDSGDGDLDVLLELGENLDLSKYEVRKIHQVVGEDLNALNRALASLERISATGDDKLRNLKHLLTSELKGKKVLLFSYFADTARYLYRNLGNPEAFPRTDTKQRALMDTFLNKLGHRQVSIVDGGVDARDRVDRVVRFAPNANEEPQIAGTRQELQLLISTDVLSEGQNLQDANIVINYDLHWNPVRMVQRAGRVDRLGSLFEKVHIFNFNPESELESLLNLVKTLEAKIDNIRQAGLLEDPLLRNQEEHSAQFNALRRIAREDQSVVTDLERMSELEIGEFLKQQLLEFVKKATAEKLKQIPLGVGSGMRNKDERGVFAAIKDTRNERHWWLFLDLLTGKISDTKLEIAAKICCPPEEVPVVPSFDAAGYIDQLKLEVLNRTKQLGSHMLALPSPQNYIVQFLQAYCSTKNPLLDLLQYFHLPLPKMLLRDLKNVWKECRDEEPLQIVEHLRDFSETHPLPQTVSPETQAVQLEDLQVICWLAIG